MLWIFLPGMSKNIIDFYWKNSWKKTHLFLINDRAFQIGVQFKFDTKHFFLTLLGSCRYYEGQLANLTELEDDGPEPKGSKKLLIEAATERCAYLFLSEGWSGIDLSFLGCPLGMTVSVFLCWM